MMKNRWLYYACYLYVAAALLLPADVAFASEVMVPTPSDAGPAYSEVVGFAEPEGPQPVLSGEVVAFSDSPAPLSLDGGDWVNVALFDVSISGTQYIAAFPSSYGPCLLVDSDGYLWNVSGSSITGRLFQGSFDPTADTGTLLYLNPCLGNNFTSNHEYGSPNYIREYYWSSLDRLSYDTEYVMVQVLGTHHLYQTGDLLNYVIIFLIGCCLICLWKRPGR